MNGKQASLLQEKQIAKLIKGRVQANSGGTKFGGGDVLTENVFVEAKTQVTDKDSFSIKKEWLVKAAEQSFEQRKDCYALAFRFGPEQPDYFVIDARTFKALVDMYDYVNHVGEREEYE